MTNIDYYEEWLPVKGYEGFYEVSNWGRVRSLSKKDSIGRYYTGKLLSLCSHSKGYLYITLCKDAKRKNRLVHTLVLEAFIGLCPMGKQSDHKDRDRANNCLYNLRYRSIRLNCGEHSMKLTDQQIIEARRLSKEGMTAEAIADNFGVTRRYMYKIISYDRRSI